MKDFLLYASVVVLFLVCLLVVLIILMQRPSANAGMGSALGGGAAESVFGGESANVLSKMTTTLTVILFILSFGLYLGFVAREKKVPSAIAPAAVTTAKPATPEAPAAPATTAPAATTPAAPAPAAPAVPAAKAPEAPQAPVAPATPAPAK
jgi:preprotein translocase subunit SecG